MCIKHMNKINIMHRDIDSFGYIDITKYLFYFEQARISFFKDILRCEFENGNLSILVVCNEVNYNLPFNLHDKVIIETTVDCWGTELITLSYRIKINKNKKEILIATIRCIFTCFDPVRITLNNIPSERKQLLIDI